MCTPQKCVSTLYQFKCTSCPGKDGQPYKLWYENVKGERPQSRCHGCGEMRHAVPRGQEEGNFVCYFICDCSHSFVGWCRMIDTSPCYGCRAQVPPCHFMPKNKIKRISDNVHSCSRCNGSGNCPTKNGRPAFG